ncbi:MAG: hypothetical protein C0625_01955 [Arcobacter sp.]|nr:MAG: hypothetical protein C0625_01955 [Arcobacter sp.]
MKCKLFDYLKIKSFSTYWDNYGGFAAIVSSPYFRISILISLIIIMFGSTEKWYDLPLNVLPNLLGFSIGAYAVVLVLGNGDFWKFIAQDNQDNLFMQINSSFVHFIFVQVVSIIFALICESLSTTNSLIAFIGYFLLIYAIFTAFAATLAILEVSKYYQVFLIELDKKKKREQAEGKE